MANNPFPLISHVSCKQVLPHAAPGARRCTHLTLHLSSYSTKLPLAPGSRFPNAAEPSQGNDQTSAKRGSWRRSARCRGCARPVLGYEACSALWAMGYRYQQQLLSLPTSSNSAAVCSCGCWKDPSSSAPFHIPPSTSSEGSRPCCKGRTPLHIPATEDSSTEECEATSTPVNAQHLRLTAG